MLEHHFLIADDHPLFRVALRETLLHLYPKARIGEVSRLEAALDYLGMHRGTHLALVDLSMPGMQGYTGLVALQTYHTETAIVVVSAHEDPRVIAQCFECGVSGFIPKSTGIEEIYRALETIISGKTWAPSTIRIPQARKEQIELAKRLGALTPQQFRVLMMLREGFLNKQIAHELQVSEATVKAHVSAILRKLCVESRTQAVISLSKLNTAHLGHEGTQLGEAL